jgi:thiol-disulfide isomerase/thioredoxin
MRKLVFSLFLMIASLGATTLFANDKNLQMLIKTAPILNTEKKLQVSDLRGKIVLIDFWTYGCINCIQIIPDLKFLEEKYPEQLVVIGVHSAKFANEKGSAEIRKAIARYGITHPVANDSDFLIWNYFNVDAWPTQILLDTKGEIVAKVSGEGHRADLDQKIAEVLKTSGKMNTTKIAMKKADEKNLLKFPSKMIYVPAFNADGEKARDVFILSDSSHHQIVLFDKNKKVISKIGNGNEGFVDGDEKSAMLRRPQGLAAIGNRLYIADTGNHVLRAYDFKTKKLSTLGGDGTRGSTWASPWALAVLNNHELLIAMAGTHQLMSFDLGTKKISVVAGTGAESIDDGALGLNSLSQPSGLSKLDDKIYFVDSETSSLRVLEKGIVTTLIGKGLFDFGLIDGDKTKARMQHALGVFATKEKIYLADTYNNALREYDMKSGQLKTITKKLNEPNDVLVVDRKILVVNTGNHEVVTVDSKTGAIAKYFP